MLADASLELQLLRDAQGYGVGFQQLSDTAVATPRAMSLLDAAAGLSLSEQSPLPSPKTASGVAAALEALAYSTVRWMPRTRAVGVDVRERRPSPLPDAAAAAAEVAPGAEQSHLPSPEAAAAPAATPDVASERAPEPGGQSSSERARASGPGCSAQAAHGTAEGAEAADSAEEAALRLPVRPSTTVSGAAVRAGTSIRVRTRVRVRRGKNNSSHAHATAPAGPGSAEPEQPTAPASGQQRRGSQAHSV